MSHPAPPRFAHSLLLRCTRLRRHEEIIADLDDLFLSRAEQRGWRYAQIRY